MPTSRVVVHDPGCRAASGAVIAAAAAVRQEPHAFPHAACLPGGWTRLTVVLERQAVAPHEYQPSMIWPAGQPRALCAVCRNPYPSHRQES